MGRVRLWPSQGGQFNSAGNPVITATDKPSFTGTTNLSCMFLRATKLVAVPGIKDCDVSKVQNMAFMFFKVTISTQHYNVLIKGWSERNNLQSGISFDAGNAKYSANYKQYRDILTGAPNNWMVSDRGEVTSN